MRVIAGKKKGLKLKAPKTGLRPLTDRVKSALFNILGSTVVDKRFLDLFAGSGAVGIEALSRGSKIAFFVEKDRRSVRTIWENLRYTEFDNQSEVFGLDVIKALPLLTRNNAEFDVIYLGAPYGSPDLEKALEIIGEIQILSRTGMIIAEHRSKNQLKDNYNSLQKLKNYKYGDTTLAFYNKGMSNEDSRLSR